MKDTKAVGDITTARVAAALLEAGYVVLLPWGDNQRYDLVIERDGHFERVQCKTGRIKNGVMLFETRSNYFHRGRGHKGYRGEVEYFGVYCAILNRCFLVPIDVAGSGGGYLRVEPQRLRSARIARWADEFEIGSFRGSSMAELRPVKSGDVGSTPTL